YGDAALDALDYGAQLQGRRHAHRDVILLAAVGRQVVHARRVRQHLALVQERDGDDLRDHVARLDARASGEEGRQPLVLVGVDEAVNPSLDDVAEVHERYARVVEGDGERRAVEVAARNDLARVGEDERVVGGRARLHFDGRARVRECVAAGPVHLRHAAQGVRVLHALVAFEVRGANPAVAQEFSQVRRYFHLPAVRAREVYALVEGGGRALQGFQGHRAGNVGRAREAQGAFERERADGRQRLRAVQKPQPLF